MDPLYVSFLFLSFVEQRLLFLIFSQIKELQLLIFDVGETEREESLGFGQLVGKKKEM